VKISVTIAKTNILLKAVKMAVQYHLLDTTGPLGEVHHQFRFAPLKQNLQKLTIILTLILLTLLNPIIWWSTVLGSELLPWCPENVTYLLSLLISWRNRYSVCGYNAYIES